MTTRGLSSAAVVLLLGLNTWSGLTKVEAFRHRYRGEMALTRAELDLAYASLRRSIAWDGGDAQSHVLIGRVIQLAQANGLPIESLEGHTPIETLGIGVAEVVRGISMNPADSWAWFNLADLYQGYRTGARRLEAMRRAGEIARLLESGASRPETPPPAQSPFSMEDGITVAAALQAKRLEPYYFFHRDFLAKLYLERGLTEAAGRQIRESLALWPRVEAHPVLDDVDFLRALQDPILEGVRASASSEYAGPVMAARAEGRILERLGRLDEAIAAWEELRRIGDVEIEAECDLELGQLQQRRGAYVESLDFLERAARSAPGTRHGIWALYYIGVAWSRQGDHDKAIAFFRQHLARAPESLAGYLSLASELERIGQSGEAERLYIAAVRRFPDNPATYLRAIDQLRRHGKAKQALLYAEGLRKISPGDEQAERLVLELSQEAAPRLP